MSLVRAARASGTYPAAGRNGRSGHFLLRMQDQCSARRLKVGIDTVSFSCRKYIGQSGAMAGRLHENRLARAEKIASAHPVLGQFFEMNADDPCMSDIDQAVRVARLYRRVEPGFPGHDSAKDPWIHVVIGGGVVKAVRLGRSDVSEHRQKSRCGDFARHAGMNAVDDHHF